MVDTSAIHALIGRARLRARLQAALDGATLATVLAFAAGLAVVFAYRMAWLDAGAALGALIGAAAIIPAGALIAAARRVPSHVLAQRIDRASGLADRLGSACAFEAVLARRGSDPGADPETLALMEAAVRDAIKSLPRANLVAAVPYRAPLDWPAALVSAVVFALVALLGWTRPVDVVLATGGDVTLDGKALPDEDGARGTLLFIAAAGDASDFRVDLGSSGPAHYQVDAEPGSYRIDFEPAAALCADGAQHRMPCLGGTVVPAITLGADAQAHAAGFALACTGTTCDLDIDIKSAVGRPTEAVAFEDDDADYMRDLLQDLRQTAETDRDPTLLEFANKVEELLTKAERGELTKEKLLEELSKAEQEFNKEDAKIQEALSDLKDTGKELKKDPLTKELGKALEKGDFDKAQQEMEKLADKMENDQLSDKQRKQLADALDKASDKFQKKEAKRDADSKDQIAKKEDAIKKLEQKRDQAKNEQQKQEMSRRIEKEKRELKRLQREKEEREQSQAKRQLKELHRNMKQAAEDMRRQNQTQQQRRQASQKMRAAARNTGKVDQDQRKTATQKKVASQLDDLREAMRRAKQQGNRGPKDLFGKNRRQNDFNRRARGGQGARTAWKPGQGQPGGKQPGGQNGQQPGGKGQQPGGSEPGTEHDPNLYGDPTARQGDNTDESVQGSQGRDGESTRETILAAAQKGFASRQYKRVYANYKAIVEEVMNSEKVPSGYKYYVKRYFQKIKPHSMD